MYTHGFLIPIIAGYVCWATRGKLPAVCQPSFAVGLPVLLGGPAAVDDRTSRKSWGAAGAVADSGHVRCRAADRRSLARSRARAADLVLVADDPRVGGLHRSTSRAVPTVFSEFRYRVVARSSGYPVYRDGTFIYLPNQTLEVAQVCSGVNYLVAIAAVGIPLAYLSRSTVARRTALVLFGVIVAVIANGVRVALIGFTAYHGLVTGDLHGPGHVFHGMFVAVAGYVALFLGAPRIVGTSLAGAGDVGLASE